MNDFCSYFGGSKYALKPSVIVTYSIGEFGGMRAAMALRPFLSELGCLPVSAIAAFPKAQTTLDEDGKPLDENVLRRLKSPFEQFDFWIAAAKTQRELNKE